MSFATRLKKLRNARSVTQQELADYLNVTRPTIAGYETKGKEPDYDTLFRIASFFDVSVDYLLSGKEYPESLAPATHSEFEMLYDDYMILSPPARDGITQLIEKTRGMDETDIDRLVGYATLLLYQPKYTTNKADEH